MNPREISSPAFIFLVLANLLASVQSTCLNNGNYTANSTYSANLNTALSALSTNIGDNGFYNISVGQDPDRANAAALCRGDVQLDICRNCTRDTATALLQSCPNQKQAINWHEFCMVRYSNERIFGTLETSPMFSWLNINNASNPDQFEEDLRTLTDNLRGRAAYGGPLTKVAAENVTAPDFQTIYALVQCTPDLSPDNCSSCLIESAQYLPTCCDRKIGGGVFRPSCTLRFEVYPFYNETRLQELYAPVPAPNRPPILSPPGSKEDNITTKIVIIVIVTIVVCLILAACGIIFLRRRIKQRPHLFLETTDSDEISAIESLHYDFGKIRDATNNFSDSNKLGQGGFGVVYKGKLLNGQEIAVKRLSRDSGQGNLEFKNEVLLLARLQHKNLVKFLGFSLEGTERLLIYEFVQNSSLDQFIFDPIKRTYLDWTSCYKIIGGIARGLLYLHEDSRLRIIHRDLKASNILLDKEMNPKIADFGMARLFGQDETHGTTNRIVGTYGYMSPEYAMHGQFSPKSDVFSFGVLVLEILSGRKNSYTRNEESVDDLLSFIWKNWSEGIAANVIDPILRASTDSTQDMLRCIQMGLLCVQENVVDRPTMASIVLMLNSYTIDLPRPKQPAFFVDSLYGPKTEATIYEGISLNFMSVTQLYPR